jgi:hypothetical protein
MTVLRIFVSALLVSALAGQAWAQQQKPRKPAGKPGSAVTMHKCIDAHGKVYYSDKLTPDCERSSQLSRQGITVTPNPASGTAVQGAQKPGAAPTAQALADERRDKALVATYTTEQEIELAQDRNLQAPLQAVKVAETRLGKLDKELEGLQKQAEGFTSKNKPVPAHLTEELNRKQSTQSALKSELAQKNTQVSQIRARYEADKLRFRELKGQPAR